MQIELRLTTSTNQVVTCSVCSVDDAPCTGLQAKALCKYRLEQELQGFTVAFKSYQSAPGKPEEPLSDDAHVMTGAVLIFSSEVKLEPTVLEVLAKHRKMLKYLLEEEVLTVCSKYGAKLFGAASPPSTSRASNGQLRGSLVAVLAAVSAPMEVDDFAKGMDSACNCDRSGESRELQSC